VSSVAQRPLAYAPFQPAALDRPALDWLCDEAGAEVPAFDGGRRVTADEVRRAPDELAA
jgi:hypothetical protein